MSRSGKFNNFRTLRISAESHRISKILKILNHLRLHLELPTPQFKLHLLSTNPLAFAAYQRTKESEALPLFPELRQMVERVVNILLKQFHPGRVNFELLLALVPQ